MTPQELINQKDELKRWMELERELPLLDRQIQDLTKRRAQVWDEQNAIGRVYGTESRLIFIDDVVLRLGNSYITVERVEKL
jgi:hypothetical protein